MPADTFNNISEHELRLWDEFRAGNEAAFAALVKRYSNTLFTYGYQICRDRDLVKDCIQEVCLELWNRRGRISAVNSVKWYLIKSIRTRIFKDRSKWRTNEMVDDDYMFIVEFNIESQLVLETETLEFISRVKTVINGLPARQREIIYLRFYENLSFDQICEVMNISKQSVHNLLQKAYRSFRSEWMLVFAVMSIAYRYFFYLKDSRL